MAWVATISKTCLLILLTIPSTVFVYIPCLVFVILPCLLWRKVIIFLAEFLHPEFVSVVHPRNAAIATESSPGIPFSTLISVGIVSGPYSLEKYRFYVQNRVLNNHRWVRNTQVDYGELKRYWKTWCGFLFWRDDRYFHTDNHITEYEHNLSVNEKELIKITQILEKKPFHPERSPWEIVLIPRVRIHTALFDGESETEQETVTEGWAIVYRMHHGFADGYSIIKNFWLLSDENPVLLEPNSSLYTKKSWSSWFYELLAPLLTPYYVTSQIFESKFQNWVWRPRKIKHDTPCEWHVVRSKSISISVIKQIKNRFKVSFNAVLLASIAGGIRQFIQKQGESKIPDNDMTMLCVTALPWPGHPWKMRNHWTSVNAQLPIGTKGKMKRLLKVHENLVSLRKSAQLLIHFELVHLIGLLPVCLIRKFRNQPCTVLASNFAFPKSDITICDDVLVEDLFFWGGLAEGNAGINIAILSYAGKLNLLVCTDQTVLPSPEDAERISDLITEQFVSLLQRV